jgi:D-proline reductase (dithiol) PrdB
MMVADVTFATPTIDQAKFDKWVQNTNNLHTDMRHIRNDPIAWAPLRKPVKDCQVALVSTGGVHLTSQEPFRMYDPHGDDSSRAIPAGAKTQNLRFAHDHYDHGDADDDPNCMFPLDRLRELVAAGEVGREAPRHFGFMGFIPNPTRLIAETAPAAASQLVADGTDVAILTPS